MVKNGNNFLHVDFRMSNLTVNNILEGLCDKRSVTSVGTNFAKIENFNVKTIFYPKNLYLNLKIVMILNTNSTMF